MHKTVEKKSAKPDSLNPGKGLAELDRARGKYFRPDPPTWCMGQKHIILCFLENIEILYIRDSICAGYMTKAKAHWCIPGLKRYK